MEVDDEPCQRVVPVKAEQPGRQQDKTDRRAVADQHDMAHQGNQADNLPLEREQQCLRRRQLQKGGGLFTGLPGPQPVCRRRPHGISHPPIAQVMLLFGHCSSAGVSVVLALS